MSPSKILFGIAAILAALFLLGCGEDPTPTGVTPSPTPTPLEELCKPLRTDITAEAKGKPATAWALGQVATLTASIVFAESDPKLTAECPQLNSVTWKILHNGDPLCSFQGVLDAKTTRVVCITGGRGLIEAQPQGFDVKPAVFGFTVLQPEALK